MSQAGLLKVGVAQFSGTRDREGNIAAVRRLASKAAAQGVNFLSFHELANTVYVPFSDDRALFDLAEPEDGYSVSAARETARERELVLVYPFFENEDGHYYNSAIIFGPRGEKLLKYRKHAIPSSRVHYGAVTERYFFEPGNLGFPVAATPFGVNVGMVICYERNLPEPARCVALNGADLVFIPVATTKGALSRWELLLRARAVENIIYVAAASRVGKDEGGAPNGTYIGQSLIVNPRGEIVGQGSATAEDLVVAELDLELQRAQRKLWPFFDDRRPTEYGEITRAVTAGR